MSGIHFCGWVPVREFLCLFWRESYTKGLHTRFPTRLEEDKEKQGPRAVNRSQKKAMVREKWLLSEKLGPVDSEARSANARGWVSVPGSCVGIFKYMLETAPEAQNAGKMPKLLSSYAWS